MHKDFLSTAGLEVNKGFKSPIKQKTKCVGDKEMSCDMKFPTMWYMRPGVLQVGGVKSGRV